MNNLIKEETKTIYVTSNRSHESLESAIDEVIEQSIREVMGIPSGFTLLDISRAFIFILKNKQLIGEVLNRGVRLE